MSPDVETALVRLETGGPLQPLISPFVVNHPDVWSGSGFHRGGPVESTSRPRLVSLRTSLTECGEARWTSPWCEQERMEFLFSSPVKKHIVLLGEELPASASALLAVGGAWPTSPCSFPKPPVWSTVRAWKSCCSAGGVAVTLFLPAPAPGSRSGLGSLCWLCVWLWSWIGRVTEDGGLLANGCTHHGRLESTLQPRWSSSILFCLREALQC